MISKRTIRLISLISLIGLIPLSVVFIYESAYWQKIFPGISIAQIPIGNQTRKEAQTIIQQAIAQKKPKVLRFFWDTQFWEINLEELNLVYQPQKSVEKAYNFGRDQGLISNLELCYQTWTKGKNFGLEYSINQKLLEEKIATISSQVFIPAVPPSLSRGAGSRFAGQLVKQTQKITVEPGKNGQELEQSKLMAIINRQLTNLKTRPIILPIKKVSFAFDEQTIEETRIRAEILLTKKLKIQSPNQVFEIKGEEFLPFISFKNDFDEEKLKDYIAQLATLINQSPQDALFRFEAGRAVVFQPEKNGTLIDQTKTLQLIKEGIKGLEGLEENEKLIELPVQLIEPKIKIGDINRFGIVEKIGEGHSSFQGSIPDRIHNIQLSSTKLSGILVPPGGIFSFNQSLGEVSEVTGFEQAYIIKEGRTILGDGGGVCQVSTTLFRALLNAGLPILERHAHAYRVSYYEQGSQPGFDATVFDPTADLKFKNDTPAYILIQTSINTANKTLVFEIYGTADNREVSISKAKIWDQTSPPPDLYQDDSTLPAGTVKQIDWKAWGAKVAFDWKVTRNSEVLQERTFFSSYRPWQAVYLRGKI